MRNNVVTSGAFAAGAGLDVVNGGVLVMTGGAVRENRIALTGLASKAYGAGINAEAESLGGVPSVVRITRTTISENRVDAVGDNRTAL